MESRPPEEGDIHSVVKIDDHTFVLRYGYYEERDRIGGAPCLLLPDLEAEPVYTSGGFPVVTAIQSVCAHYTIPEHKIREDCCYTCGYYQNPKAEISICKCPHRQIAPRADISDGRNTI